MLLSESVLIITGSPFDDQLNKIRMLMPVDANKLMLVDAKDANKLMLVDP